MWSAYEAFGTLPEAFANGSAGSQKLLHDGKVIVDSGATETIGSPEAMDCLLARVLATNPNAQITVDPTQQPRFRFGNGTVSQAYSRVGIEVPFGTFWCYVVEGPGVPILLSVRALRDLRATLNFEDNSITVKMKGQSMRKKLECSSRGHMLLDLTEPADTYEKL